MRRWTDDEKARALVALDACGGNHAEARARLAEAGLDVPVRTLRAWATGERPVGPFVQALRTDRREALVEGMQELLGQMLDKLGRDLDRADFRDAAVAFGIVADKMQLLSGEPTAISEQRGAPAVLAQFNQMVATK